MKIQQHDGMVVDATGSRQGFAKRKREGEVLRREREAPRAKVRLPSLPPRNTPPPRLRLAKPCRYPAASITTPSCCWIFINLFFPLAGSRRRKRLPNRTCVERGGAVRSALGHR